MKLGPRQSAFTAGVEAYVEDSVTALNFHEVFIATIVMCLQVDSTDTAGGHRQKLYHNTLNRT